MSTAITQIILYTKRTDEMIDFYEQHFGFTVKNSDNDQLIELVHSTHSVKLLLHPSGKGMKEGQVCVKLVFDVEDVQAFCNQARRNGLEFGPIHKADGYEFANAKDPSKNSISVSSRAFRNG